MVDSAGGSAAFADSADGLVKTLFPAATPKPLPPEHPVYQTGDQPLTVEYRGYAKKNLTGALRGGRLTGVEVGDRLGVVVSREDLSVGLVGQSVDGVIGYSPQTATRLMANILLGAASKRPTPSPATRTTTKPTAK